jgi:hypothetical protein
MLFSAKPKGYFVEQTDHALMLARTSAATGPLVIEEVRECAPGDGAALAAALKQLQPKKSSSGYVHASCGVYTPRRFLRRMTLDPKRLKEPAYFGEILTQQFRVEPDKAVTMVLNAPDGTDYDVSKGASQKEALFAGMLSEEIVTSQDALLANGIYPERIELGTVSTLGGLVNYLNFLKSKTPTLVLEVGAESTNSFIVSSVGVEATRPIPQGLESMIPVVQKELGLKDEESARKLFYSNTFDFTGMGPLLIKKLLKELQSSIGFYEVQTGQSVGLLISTIIPAKLGWLDVTIAKELGISPLKLDTAPWLESHGITVSEAAKPVLDQRWFGLLSLMARHETANPAANAVAAEKKA